MFAIDPLDGSVLWENGLPKMGTGVVALATMRTSAPLDGAYAEQQGQQDAQAAAT